ncbi:hypothetical protein BFG60_2303 [Microcystis aeruginosa NIES-98]|nr:hypothetical protein BFG60_2303 [Microcystis aeruginosa NIES-98]
MLNGKAIGGCSVAIGENASGGTGHSGLGCCTDKLGLGTVANG